MKKSYGFVVLNIVMGNTPKQRYWEHKMLANDLACTLKKSALLANVKHLNNK